MRKTSSRSFWDGMQHPSEPAEASYHDQMPRKPKIKSPATGDSPSLLSALDQHCPGALVEVQTFGVAVAWKRLPQNPYGAVQQLRVDEKPKTVFSRGEYTRFVNGITEGWFRDLILFNVLTGLRLGEIMNLKWEDYNTDASEITVRSRPEYRVKEAK